MRPQYAVNMRDRFRHASLDGLYTETGLAGDILITHAIATMGEEN